MSATIVPFPGPNAEGARDKAVLARAEGEAERRAYVRELRAALLDRSGKMKLKRKLQSHDDAVLLARRLGQDLEQVKRRGRGLLAETLEAAGHKLTSRARYALFAGDEAGERRIRKLQPYVSLSDAIAIQLQQDSDLFLYEKLDGLGLIEADTPGDDEASTLGLLLDEMARSVAEKTRLIEFFDLAERTPGVLNESGRISASRMTVLRDRGHEGGFDHWSEPQPVPSIPICRLLERRIGGRARIGPWVGVSPDGLPALVEAVDAVPIEDSVDIIVEVWREIGLAIGERHQRGGIGPMLSGRAHIKVEIDGVDAEPFYPCTLEHFFLEQPAILLGGGQWSACHADLELEGDYDDAGVEPAQPPGQPSFAREHYYFSMHAANAWNLRRVLDRGEYDEPQAELLLADPSADDKPEMQFRFSGSIGQAFERSLFSGALEESLITEITRLKLELERHRSVRRSRFADQDQEMLARWRSSKEPDVGGSEPG